MKHCAKKLLGLAFALALCLAVGGTALAQTPEFADVPAALPEQEMLAFEPNVTTAADVPNTVTGDGYTVTIPTTVTVESGENNGKLEVKGELEVTAVMKQWRTLLIEIAPQTPSASGVWTLKYNGNASDGTNLPQVEYNLPELDMSLDELGNPTYEWVYDGLRKHLSFNSPKLGGSEDVSQTKTITAKLAVTVPHPEQATMSGTYSDTLTFRITPDKTCVTYNINVYEQELQLTNSGTHVQVVDVVDANGNVIGNPTPKLTKTFEYPLEDKDYPWTYSSNDPEDDKLRWEELPTVTMNAHKDNQEGRTSVTFNLNLKRKWYWLDVNGITNKDDCADRQTDGNQRGKIASFVNIRVSVDDGTNWSDWFWYFGGDDYWGTFPYGTKFQLGLHRVKDGYAYDADADGNVAIYANSVLTHTQTTDVSGDGKTHYRVYQGKLEGEPVDKTPHSTSEGGNYHAAGSYPRYCYNVCFVDGITYYANGGTSGREDTNLYHGPHTTFKYTADMTLADPLNDDSTGCKFTAPDGKEFAGWSTTKDYTGQTLYGVGDSVSSVTWPARPTVSNNDTLPTNDGQTECRTLYAIWKKPYKVKVQFGGVIGWTTWDAANQSFPENKQGGDGFDEPAVELGTAYAYGNTSLTLSETENKTVWNALKAKITEKTSAIADTTPPEDVWQLKDEYTFTTLPANGEVTIKIKRKRYLLNVIPALQKDDGTFTPVSNATDAEQYGKFNLYSCGRPQTLEGKISYYQWMRNYGGSYRICDVEANTGYQFVGFRVIETNAPVDKGKNPYSSTLTGKNEKLSYFGDTSGNTYTGDTIYVMYKKDMVTFDYNGGTTADGATEQVLPYDETIHFPKVVLTHPNNVTHIGWSTKQDPTSDAEIFKLASFDPDNGVNPDTTTVSSKVTTWPDENNKVLYAVWRSTTGPNRAPAKKALTVRYHANFDPMEELALDLDPDPLLEDMDDTFGFDPDPLPEDVLDPTVEAVKTVTYQPGEDVILRNCMFKRGGYVFVGWNTEPDGTGKKYEVNGVPITDWAAGDTVDLYAQWKKPEHLKPVVDSEPFVPADPDTPPERVDDGFDADFGADPDPLPEGMDDAFGVDPAAQPEGMDDAFGVDPAAQPETLDDAFGV